MTIDTQQLYFILENTPAEQNILLVGKHGIGKSRILEDFYTKKGCKVVSLFLGQMSDPGDLIGLPEKDEKTGKTEFLLPYWFPTDRKPVVLFLDELNRARPEVLQTIMDLTLNRRLAGKSLPLGSRIISAVNNGSEYQLTDLDPALISRFNIYEFAPSVSDWLCWADGAGGIDSRITAFIRENPEYLDSDAFYADADSLERTPDRRSWERASDILKKIDAVGDVHKPLFAGIVGSRAASLLFGFLAEHSAPSARKVLTGNFEALKPEIRALSVPSLTALNKSLFTFIEHGLNEEDAFSDSAVQESVKKNLVLYFEFLKSEAFKEVCAHFVDQCSASSFPKTLRFIARHCMALYNAFSSFILD